MTLERATQIVQVAFPQIYLACHTRHQRKRTTAHRLSPRDASLLAHLDERTPTVPSKLAAHLGVGRPTMSEALKRLVAHGFVERAPARGGVLLSAKGALAIRETSVLETDRLRAAMQALPRRELRRITDGLAALAAACRTLDDGGDRGRA